MIAQPSILHFCQGGTTHNVHAHQRTSHHFKMSLNTMQKKRLLDALIKKTRLHFLLCQDVIKFSICTNNTACACEFV